MKHSSKLFTVVATISILALAGCSTVKMPKIDIMKSPQFENDSKNIGNTYPKVGAAPQAPADIRSDRAWDKDAEQLQALAAASSDIPPVEEVLTPAQIDARYRDLAAKAQAYKLDDPIGGPN